jgi:hypothetical protein
LPAVGAGAQDNSPDPGVRCAAKIGPGEYEFYMPGAKVTDVNGDKWVCGPDGQWFRDYSAIRAGTAVSDKAGTLAGFKSTSITRMKLAASPNGTLQMAR